MRLLLILLALLIAAPVAPGLVGAGGSSPAYADDDDDDDDRRRKKPRPRLIRREAPAPQSRPVTRPLTPPTARANEIVVGTATIADLDLILAAGFTLIESSPAPLAGGVVARLRPPARLSIDAARARVRELLPAAIAAPNHLYRPVELRCSKDDCPTFEMIGWRVSADRCSAPVTLGMIDTPVNTAHEALRNRSVEIISMLSVDDREAAAVHGTAIASLLVGDDDSRTPGLLPDAQLVAIEAFHRDRAGDAADVYAIVRGMGNLTARGVAVINMSFAGPENALLERAVSDAVGRGAFLVAAAGNGGPKSPPAYPAAYAGVIAVTAVDLDGKVYRQAGRGDHIAFSAPGVRLWTAASVSGGRYRSGTSYAAPFVSAAIAAARVADPQGSAAEIVGGLASEADDLGQTGRDAVFGWGLIKAPPCESARSGD